MYGRKRAKGKRNEVKEQSDECDECQDECEDECDDECNDECTELNRMCAVNFNSCFSELRT